jgi:hypothetical protein
VKGSQMIAGTSDLFANIDQHLRPAMVGMWLAILTLLFGFTPGIFFSLHNEAIRSRLNACAAEVRDSIYWGDDQKINAVLDMSWSSIQHAGLLAGGLGGTSIYLIFTVLLLPARRLTQKSHEAT